MQTYTKQLALAILILLICGLLAWTIGRDNAGIQSTIIYGQVR